MSKAVTKRNVFENAAAVDADSDLAVSRSSGGADFGELRLSLVNVFLQLLEF